MSVGGSPVQVLSHMDRAGEGGRTQERPEL